MEKRPIETQKHTSERGQSIILLAFVFVSFLIIVGLAIDLGLVYIERVRLGRAVDAAVLGGVQELPDEEAAFARALMFLRDNGYDLATNATIYYNGQWVTASRPPGTAPATIYINTADYRELDEFNNPIDDTAMRIRVEGTRDVPLNFMKFAGPQFSAVPVGGRAVAENVQDLDVVVVFDRSGSMQFDTICYGCWEVDNLDGYDYRDWPSGEEYPGGDPHPLAYPHELCSGYSATDMYRTYNGYRYVSIEAEHFYNNWPIFNPDYRGTQSGVKTSYWGLQRNGRGSSTVGDDSTRCQGITGERAGCGGYMQHNPFTVYPDDDEQVYSSSELAAAPQLVYRFQVPSSGTYRLWLRGQGGASGWSANVDQRTIHWGLNGSYRGTSTNFQSGEMYDGARYDRWRWRRVDEFSLVAGQTYDLNIWAGGAGFRLDKIVITNAPDWEADDILLNPGTGTSETQKGPAATAGLSGFACWSCYPLFGRPTSQACEDTWNANPQWQEMYSAMFDDQQPVRAAKEAVKMFIDPPEDLESRLEPKFDQVGFVSYSSNSTIDSELECVKRLGSGCTSFQSVLNEIEVIISDGSTSMASALWDGILVLMNGREVSSNDLTRVVNRLHYGRSGTSKFIVLMTDGEPNVRPRDRFGNYVACPDLYPDSGLSSNDEISRDCVVYFAQKARDNGIIVYTIGLGDGVVEPLLISVADTTGGNYFPAPDKDDLERIFMQILQQIYIRLVE